MNKLKESKKSLKFKIFKESKEHFKVIRSKNLKMKEFDDYVILIW